MSKPRCVTCGDRWGAKARGGLCLPCWEARQPDTVEGLSIRAIREALGISIMDAASSIHLDPKSWIDAIEQATLSADHSKAISVVLECLHEERIAAAAGHEAKPLPADALSADIIQAA